MKLFNNKIAFNNSLKHKSPNHQRLKLNNQKVNKFLVIFKQKIVNYVQLTIALNVKKIIICLKILAYKIAC